MLFNSYTFLLLFAPICFFWVFWLGNRSHRLAAGSLALASIVFYSCWNPWNLPILIISILFNYGAGLAIERTGVPGNRKRALLMCAAIAVNLTALCYYKYANFLVSNLASLTGLHLTMAAVILPLGISFFTFTQIAYLIDTERGKVVERNPIHYLLFVTYFPHLIAGPVIHHKDVMPQFAARDAFRFHPANFTIGAIMFILGLFKKCFIADNIAAYANPFFQVVEKGFHPGLFEAWSGALAYTLQIYFDFSGYSDMAVRVALMLNIRLPINFNSPYKAKNIIEFWKRWHISLSTFLREYLYIPLGGNRKGGTRRYVNLLLTMLIGGFWHGAAWTFIAWGGLHGAYLIINHGWRNLRGRMMPQASETEKWIGHVLTFIAVVIAWVFFRAPTFHDAASILAGMAGMYGAEEITSAALPVWCWIAVLLPAALLLPNSQQLVEREFTTGAYLHHVHEGAAWKTPSPVWALGIGIFAALAIMNLLQPAEFLYFNF